MKILTDPQGSDAWLRSRIGRVTASCFDQVVQPKKLGPSASQDKYLAKLVAEWLLDVSLDEAASQFMERGTALEPEAAAAYEWKHDITTEQVGLVLRDCGKVGASPDRLVGEKGLAEFKVPGLTTHVGYMLNPALLRAEYFAQVQGELWVCEREWADLVSYHPSLPSVEIRITPDPDFIACLEREIPAFVARLDAAKEKLQPLKAARATEAATARAEAGESTEHGF